MTQTTSASSPASSPPARAGRSDQVAPAFVASGGRQRRWSLALLAVLLTVGSGLAFVVLWLNAGDRKPYLALSQDVAAGQQITADHLTTVRVSADPALSPVAASQRDEVIGQVAASDMVAGSLLVESALGEDEGLESDQAVIGVPIERERLPSPLPETRDTVRVYDVGADPDSDSERILSAAVAEATVMEVEDLGTHVTFTLLVDERDLVDLTATVETEGLYLVLVEQG